MRPTLSIIFFLVTLVCHSQDNDRQWVDLNKFAKEKYKNNILKKDPLILVDGKIVGLLSEIDLNNLKFSPKHPSSLQVLSKGSICLQKIWGKNAENGVINILNHITLYCRRDRSYVFILDDKETDRTIVEKLNSEDIQDWVEIQPAVDYQGKVLKLTVVNTINEQE